MFSLSVLEASQKESAACFCFFFQGFLANFEGIVNHLGFACERGSGREQAGGNGHTLVDRDREGLVCYFEWQWQWHLAAPTETATQRDDGEPRRSDGGARSHRKFACD